MTRSMLVLCFLLLLTRVSDAQLLCTPLSDATYCAGYDAQMQERTITVTPLGGEMTIITEPIPRPREADPGFLVPRVQLAPAMRRPGPILDAPGHRRLERLLDEEPRMRDELLPPVPFPE